MCVIGLIIRQRILRGRRLQIHSEKLSLQYRRTRELRELNKMTRFFDEPVQEAKRDLNEAQIKYNEMLTLGSKIKRALEADAKAEAEDKPESGDTPPASGTISKEMAEILASIEKGTYKMGDMTITKAEDITTAIEAQKTEVAMFKTEYDSRCSEKENNNEAYALLKTDTEKEFDLLQQELDIEGEFVKAELDALKESIPNMFKELAPKYA